MENHEETKNFVSVFLYALEETSVDLLVFSKCENFMNVFLLLFSFLCCETQSFPISFLLLYFHSLPPNKNGKNIILLFGLTMVEME